MTPWLIGILAAIIGGEFSDVTPWLAKRLAGIAARRTYTDKARAEDRAEEWCALIDERPGNLLKLGTGLTFLVGAVAGSTRQAIAREFSRRLLSIADILVSSATTGSASESYLISKLLLSIACRLGSANAHHLLGQLYESYSEVDRAISHYSAALAGGVSLVWCRLGGLLKITGQFDAAVRVYHQALPEGGDLASAELIGLLTKLGRLDEALDVDKERTGTRGKPQIIDSFLDMLSFPENPNPCGTNWGMRIWVGGLLELQGRVEEATRVYSQDPADLLAVHLLSDLGTRSGSCLTGEQLDAPGISVGYSSEKLAGAWTGWAV